MADPTAPTISVGDFIKLTFDTIQAVEQVFPAGSGKAKFDAVYAQVMAYAPLVTLLAGVAEQFVPLLINTTVANFNRFKMWLHPAAPAPTA